MKRAEGLGRTTKRQRNEALREAEAANAARADLMSLMPNGACIGAEEARVPQPTERLLKKRFHVAYAIVICLLQQAHAKPLDWGYEDATEEASSTPSQAMPKTRKLPASQNRKIDPGSTKHSVNQDTTSFYRPNTPHAGPFARETASSAFDKAISNWLELYQLVSAEKLREDQYGRYGQILLHELKNKGNIELTGILSFWPKVTARLEQQTEQKELFVTLLKALIRLQARCHKLGKDEMQIVNEVLGPERIAVPGEPALTEEAIDAYNDMACFLYEQKHPNKTIDASDNRTIMAAMICDRFKDAPNPAAKMAMVNFALAWAKFKITWANSSNEERQKLLLSFDKSGSPQSITVADPVVESVLRLGPWSALLYKNSTTGQ